MNLFSLALLLKHEVRTFLSSDKKKDTSVHGHYIELSSLGEKIYCGDNRSFHIVEITVHFSTDKTRQSTLLKQLHEQLKNKKMIISKNQLHLSDIVGQGMYIIK